MMLTKWLNIHKYHWWAKTVYVINARENQNLIITQWSWPRTCLYKHRGIEYQHRAIN